MIARDLMTKEVVTVRPDTPLEEIAGLLTLHRIGALPVVDDEGRVIGMVSLDDLFPRRKLFSYSGGSAATIFKELIDDPPHLPDLYRQSRDRTAQEVMSTNVLCVDADEELENVASLMLRHDLKRVPVLHAEKLVGIISRSDLIRLLSKTA